MVWCTMNLEDLFVKSPVKTAPVDDDIEIEGSFACQKCDFTSNIAKVRDGKIWWVCIECNFRSVVNGFG